MTRKLTRVRRLVRALTENGALVGLVLIIVGVTWNWGGGAGCIVAGTVALFAAAWRAEK